MKVTIPTQLASALLAYLSSPTAAVYTHDVFNQQHYPPMWRDESSNFELKRVFEVAGRQGVATNGTHIFNSASAGLYVYDLEGNFLYSNEE